jgi:hypothetical protein
MVIMSMQSHNYQPRTMSLLGEWCVMPCMLAGVLWVATIETYFASSQLPTYMMCLVLFTGHAVADVLSGIGHLIFDKLNPLSCPQFMRSIVTAFQQHHERPWTMLYDSFAAQNVAVYTIVLIAMYVARTIRVAGYTLFAYQIITTSVWFSCVQIAHAAAHGRHVDNRLVQVLQRIGVFVSVHTHRNHHQPPYDKNFCILSGYMEPVVRLITDMSCESLAD